MSKYKQDLSVYPLLHPLCDQQGIMDYLKLNQGITQSEPNAWQRLITITRSYLSDYKLTMPVIPHFMGKDSKINAFVNEFKVITFDHIVDFNAARTARSQLNKMMPETISDDVRTLLYKLKENSRLLFISINNNDAFLIDNTEYRTRNIIQCAFTYYEKLYYMICYITKEDRIKRLCLIDSSDNTCLLLSDDMEKNHFLVYGVLCFMTQDMYEDVISSHRWLNYEIKSIGSSSIARIAAGCAYDKYAIITKCFNKIRLSRNEPRYPLYLDFKDKAKFQLLKDYSIFFVDTERGLDYRISLSGLDDNCCLKIQGTNPILITELNMQLTL